MENLMQLVPYALGGLVAVLFALVTFKYNREKFDSIAKGVFLAIEKSMGTAEGQEKMSQAVLLVVDLLPAQLKTALEFLAKLKGTDLHGLTHELAQGVYDVMFPILEDKPQIHPPAPLPPE